MKGILGILLFSNLLSISFFAESAEPVETFSCSTCDYQNAVDIAESVHEPIQCHANLGPGASLQLGGTTFSCDTTSRSVIIANPFTRTAFKFFVSAKQLSPFGVTETVLVTDTSLTEIERDSLDEFYDIDEDFRQGFKALELQISPNLLNNSRAFTSFASSSEGEAVDCSAHPINYLTDLSFADELNNDINQRFTTEIGNQDWNDFAEDFDVTGFTVGDGTLGVNFSRENTPVFFVERFGESGTLNFLVQYSGESRASTTRNTTRGSRTTFTRNLNLIITLIPAGSRIEGLPVDSIFQDGLLQFGENVPLCIEEALDPEEETGEEGDTTAPSGSGGSGTISGSNGGEGGGGTGPSAPGGGCYIVERVVHTCRVENGDRTCAPQVVRYFDC